MQGKSVLVTGAAQGIGLAIARRFAAAGARVTIADINLPAAEASAAALIAEGGEAHAQQIDLAKVADIPAMVAHVAGARGGIDVLVNNAGVEFGGTFFEVTPEVWDAHLNINLRAMFFVTQAAASWMKEHGGGAVVNIASVQGQIFSPRFIPYTASKAGVRGLTAVMATALAPHAIRVNAVAPGWCDTSMNKLAADPAAMAERTRLIPLRRIGQPQEMADAVFFLASPHATYMTGQTITVDGGRSLGIPLV